MMWLLFRLLLVFFAVLAAALIGYAYLADLQPPEGVIIEPVTIPAD